MEAPAGSTPKAFNANHCDLPTRRDQAQLQARTNRRRSGIGPPLKRHPFSGLVDSAGELLHTP